MPRLKKRLCAAVMLCALMLSLSSCLIVINGGDETSAPLYSTDGELTSAPQVTEEIPPEDKLSANDVAKRRLESMLDYDMDGKTFILVTTDSNVPLPIGSSRILDKTRWEVLNAVSEKYGAELIVTRETRSKMISKFREASTSGLYYADILCAQSSEMGSLFAEKLLTDLTDLPFLDFDAEYYYPMARESVTVNGKIYGVAGEASVDFDVFGCIYTDLNALNTMNADIYTDIENGGWTYDRLLEYAKLYEYSEDGTYKGVNAISSSFDKSKTVEYLFEATGIRYVYSEDGTEKIYSPVGSPEDAVAAIRALCFTGNWGFELTDEEKIKYTEGELLDPEELIQLDLLMMGKGIFYIGTLNDLARVYYTERALVPIPMPKLNKEQGSYIAPTAGEACFFFIPSDSANITESAILIEALNARSKGAIGEAYVTNALHYYIRNEKSVSMLETIIERPYFDLAVNFGTRYGALRHVSVGTIRQAAEDGYNVLDVHYWNYHSAVEALKEIRTAAEQ